MKDETLLPEKMTADYAWRNLGIPEEDCSAFADGWNARAAIQSGNSEAIQDFLRVLDEYPEQLVPINRESSAVRALRNAACGNSGQVPAGYVLVPVEPTPEMMLHKSGCQHHAWDDLDCPMRETRRLVWSHMLAAAQKEV